MDGWDNIITPAGASVHYKDMVVPIQGGPSIQCEKRDIVIKSLREKYGEVSMGIGYIDDKGLLELFVSEEGTWSVVVSDPNGMSCLVSAGTDWNFDKRSPKDRLEFENAPPA